MARWRFDGERTIFYEVTVHADTEAEARRLAVAAIEEGGPADRYDEADDGLQLMLLGRADD